MVNRITQQIINRNLLNNIQDRQLSLFERQRQVSTGNRYEQASQDPRAASVALDLQSAISAQERFGENARISQDFNLFAENELTSAEDSLQRVRELNLRAANEALNEQQISALRIELEGLVDQLLDSANAIHEDRFVFGGFQTDSPPFVAERNLGVRGSALGELNLNAGTFRTQIETRSLTTLNAGAFALNGGDLYINNVDIGSFNVNDPGRSAAENATTLVERINAVTEQTGVSARAVTIPGGSFDAPGGGPLEGIALANVDSNGQPSNREIRVSGRGLDGVGGPLFRNEVVALDHTRFRSEQIGAGAIGDVPAGTVSINGVPINSAMTFAAGNSAEQNAQEIARAINTIASPNGVRASTDGHGYVELFAAQPFTIAGAPPQLQLPNQDYSQNFDAPPSGGPVTTGTALKLGRGSLVINGIDIFAEGETLAAGTTAAQRAVIVARGINRFTTESGISARATAAGEVLFNNSNTQITEVVYRGDSAENLSQLGRDNLVELYLSGDEAFGGHQRDTTLASAMDLLAAGLGTAVSTANVSFNAGDTLGPGDFNINGTDILVGPFSGVAATDASDLINAINAQSNVTNVSASLNGPAGIALNSDDGNPIVLNTANAGVRAQIPAGTYLNAIGAGDFQINGVDIGPLATLPFNAGNPVQNAQDLGQLFVDAINAQAGLTGVNASLNLSNTGSARLVLSAPGQDIRIDSTSPVPNALFQATGLSDGTVIRQEQDVFETVIRLRQQVVNSGVDRDVIESLSLQNLAEVSDSLDSLVAQRVKLGVRTQRAELVESRSALNAEVLQSQLADNREVDLSAAISQLTQEETALQAAFAVTQRINNLSLLNFI